MDKPKITPKDFFLWAGAMVAFYWSVIAFILLMFDYINYTFPNVLTYVPIDPYQSGVSYEMASIIVLFPLYLLLMRLIRRDMSRDPSRKDIWVRRWALILTLFVAGIAIAADLITLLTTFLNGEELTTAFILKVLIVLLVAGGVFMHFSMDLKGYWELFPARRRSVGYGVGILAVCTILAGFIVVGTPQEARQARLDSQRVMDLQDLQSRITYFWQAKEMLPASLVDLNDSVTYGILPTDPDTGESYTYRATGTHSFELCATFSAVSRVNYAETRAVPAGIRGAQDNWWHGAGQACFSRTIDPSFYPPLKK